MTSVDNKNNLFNLEDFCLNKIAIQGTCFFVILNLENAIYSRYKAVVETRWCSIFVGNTVKQFQVVERQVDSP